MTSDGAWVFEDLFHTLLGWQIPDYPELGLVNSVSGARPRSLCPVVGTRKEQNTTLVYKVSVLIEILPHISELVKEKEVDERGPSPPSIVPAILRVVF